MATAPAIRGQPWIHREFDRRLPHVHRAQPLIRLVEEPARHARRHNAESSRIPAEIDDDACAIRARFERVAKLRHEMCRIEKQVERKIADVTIETFRDWNQTCMGGR